MNNSVFSWSDALHRIQTNGDVNKEHDALIVHEGQPNPCAQKYHGGLEWTNKVHPTLAGTESKPNEANKPDRSWPSKHMSMYATSRTDNRGNVRLPRSHLSFCGMRTRSRGNRIKILKWFVCNGLSARKKIAHTNSYVSDASEWASKRWLPSNTCNQRTSHTMLCSVDYPLVALCSRFAFFAQFSFVYFWPSHLRMQLCKITICS